MSAQAATCGLISLAATSMFCILCNGESLVGWGCFALLVSTPGDYIFRSTVDFKNFSSGILTGCKGNNWPTFIPFFLMAKAASEKVAPHLTRLT